MSAPRYSRQSREAGTRLVDLLGEIAAGEGTTPAQVALAWLLARRPWIVPIPGTTKIHRLEENAAAAAVALTDDEKDQLTQASALIDTTVDRYPEKMQSWIDR